MTAGGDMLDFAETTWDLLERPDAPVPAVFDAQSLEDLPGPARRLLATALPDGVSLHRTVRLKMKGEIKLAGRWLPFEASQILRAGVGFVWAPSVGGRLVRFVGADALGPDGARIEFRLHGRIPIVRGSGPDVDRSAAGRLAAETVAWLPQALTPQAGAGWRGIDHHRAAVTLDGPSGPVEVEVAVGDDGRVTGLGLQRWNNAAKPPANVPFGGSVEHGFATADGVAIAGNGTVGWEWGTSKESDGVFFRYEITTAEFGSKGDGGGG